MSFSQLRAEFFSFVVFPLTVYLSLVNRYIRAGVPATLRMNQSETAPLLMQNVTIYDVANLAGVSIKTVSRVLNREPGVRLSTKVRVDHAIAELDYRPNQSARNLASNRSHQGL